MAATLEDAHARIAELEMRIAKLEKILLGSRAVNIKSPASTNPLPAGEETETPLPKIDTSAPPGPGAPVRIKSAIESHFPGIAEKLTLLWGNPECLAYLSKLMIDSRGNRKGFDLDVMNELVMLMEMAGQDNPDAWAEFVKQDNR